MRQMGSEPGRSAHSLLESKPHEMPELADVFTAVSPSIVAVISTAAVVPPGTAPPLFPSIVGTGFFVDDEGTILTNRHVVNALMSLPRHPQTGNIMAAVLAFGAPEQRSTGIAMPIATIEIAGYVPLEGFESGIWYGEEIPDLGLLVASVIETPPLSLSENNFDVRVGEEIATCGFPNGTNLVARNGRLQQLSPILRRGIISAVYPFAMAQPHGFSIDVMQQGGASGSPVFRTSDGVVLGILHSGMPGQNHTFVDPSWVIARWLRDFKKHRTPPSTPSRTLASFMAPPIEGQGPIGWVSL
jgi:hypothetical protein